MSAPQTATLYIVELFKDYLALTKGNETAAAILTLANTLSSMPVKVEAGQYVGHEICMGIRHGLFGTDASSSATFGNLSDLAEAIRRHTDRTAPEE